jgi:hypothetical protein
MKTHPAPEEWMSFLYGEDSPARHTELGAHLHACAECRRQVQTWRGSMTALDAWTAPAAPRRWVPAPAMRWAVAAAVVLGLGIGIGRMTTSANSEMKQLTAALRAEMETKLASTREEFDRTLQQQREEFVEAAHAAASDAAGEEAEELFGRIARVIDERRQKDHEAYLAALRQVEERSLTDYAALRKDLNTVAVNADDGLSQTREQLIELAAFKQSPSN